MSQLWGKVVAVKSALKLVTSLNSANGCVNPGFTAAERFPLFEE